MDLHLLRATLRYNSKLGHLYRGRDRVAGTPKHTGGPLVVWFNGRQEKFARICFALAYGYEPKQVRHRDRDHTNNRKDNL